MIDTVEIYSPWFFKVASHNAGLVWDITESSLRRERMRFPDHRIINFIQENHPTDARFTRIKAVMVK